MLDLPVKVQIDMILREGARTSNLFMGHVTGLQDSAGEKGKVMLYGKQTQVPCISKQ